MCVAAGGCHAQLMGVQLVARGLQLGLRLVALNGGCAMASTSHASQGGCQALGCGAAVLQNVVAVSAVVPV